MRRSYAEIHGIILESDNEYKKNDNDNNMTQVNENVTKDREKWLNNKEFEFGFQYLMNYQMQGSKY